MEEHDHAIYLAKVDLRSDLRDLDSLMQSLLGNAVEHMLLKKGFVLPHAAFAANDELSILFLGQLGLPEQAKKLLPEIALQMDATHVVVVTETLYRPCLLLAPPPTVPIERDPDASYSITVEGADVNRHVFIFQPFYRSSDNSIVFDDPSIGEAVGDSDVYLGGLQLKGEKVPASIEKLVRAAGQGKVALVRKLLSDGTDVNGRDAKLRTPLMAAASSGHLEVVKLLLKMGAGVDHSTHLGWTPLMEACAEGHVKIVQRLLDAGADINASWSHFGEYGGNALYTAVSGGNVALARLLLDRGANVNAEDEQGVTPLRAAAVLGFLEAVQLLVDRGADIDDQQNAVCAAAYNNHSEIVEWLLGRGISANATNQFGYSALISAAAKGHLSVVKLLLESGADANCTDTAGWTPLRHAVTNGNEQVATVLKSFGGSE